MKILVVNKFWYLRGGLERVMFDEISMLENVGHEVAHLSTAHSSNVESKWSPYFVEYLELGGGASLSATAKVRAVGRMFSNRSAADAVLRLIGDFQPDIVHAHGVHRQLSGDVLRAANGYGVPVVQTVHDYHHICPADTLLRGGSQPCAPRSCGSTFMPCIMHRCVRGSLPLSALSMAEMTWRSRSQGFGRFVRFFICPSEFMANEMGKAGFGEDRLRLLRNTVEAPVDEPKDESESDHFFFTGRLVKEKGLKVLLEAARRVKAHVLVAGEGPLSDDVRSLYADEVEAGRLRFLGHLPSSEVMRLMRSARAVVVPSIWFENASISVLEAMSIGAPIIVSAIGGLTEMVEHGTTGLHCEPGSVESLQAALKRMIDDPVGAGSLGAEAAKRFAERYSPELHLSGLMRIYEEALAAGPVRS